MNFESMLYGISGSTLSNLSFIISKSLFFNVNTPYKDKYIFIFERLLLSFCLTLPDEYPVILDISLLLNPATTDRRTMFRSSVFNMFNACFNSSRSNSRLLS